MDRIRVGKPAYQHASTPTHQHTSTTTHQHTSTPTQQHASTPHTTARQHTNTPAYHHTNTPAHQHVKHTSKPTHQHASTPTHQHTSTPTHQPVHTVVVVQQDPERLVYAALLDDVGGLDVDVVYNLQTTDRRQHRSNGKKINPSSAKSKFLSIQNSPISEKNIAVWWVWTIGRMLRTGETEVLGENDVPVPASLTKIHT